MSSNEKIAKEIASTFLSANWVDGGIVNARNSAHARAPLERLSNDIAAALLSAEQRGIERAANLIESGFDREHAEIWAKDGVTRTKFDRCPHGRQVNDDCEQCCAAAIRSLASKDNGKDG